MYVSFFIATAGATDSNEKNILLKADTYLKQGIAMSNKGDYEKAIADYNKVLELEPQYKKIYSLRGVAYLMPEKI